MEGYKTFLFGLLSMVAAVLGKYDIVLSLEDQTAIVMGVMAILTIVLRFVTKTPVFESSDE